jgi:addiction module HigA family antidote
VTTRKIKAAMLMAIRRATLTAAKLHSGGAARPPEDTLMTSQSAPIHPGEVLWKTLLAPAADALAQAIGVPPVQVEQLVRAQVPVTNDMAVRLAHHFGTSAQFWRCLQKEYDASKFKRAC